MTSALAPRVSAIMPTADRRRFVPAAVAQFLAQGREDAELVILDDGSDKVADLIPSDARIRYFREEGRRVLGDKRNRLCELARGQIIIHWDDDDWHAPDRIERQLAALDASGADLVGLERIAFLADDGGRAWDYRWGGRGRWVYGATMAYRRALWERRRFASIRAGEDTRFVLDARGARIQAMADTDWMVARVHGGNTSPKRTRGGYWSERPSGPLLERIATWSGHGAPIAAPRPLANVYALLAHERPECVVDLVRNLRWHDRVSPILLYDGSASGGLVDPRLPWARWGVEVVPGSRPMRWGALHDFALDCIAHLGDRTHDCLTIVDSDQMMLRKDYPLRLAMEGGVPGLLSSDPRPQGRGTRIPPAATAQAERPLWQPFLDRFEGGDAAFVHWTFWPATVIGAECGRAVAELFKDAQLQAILAASRLWATEEILFPTLAKLLGFPVQQNPCRGDWTQYRRRWSSRDIDAARSDPSAFWMHPVPRALDDPLRRHLRERSDHYRLAAAAPRPEPKADEAVLAEMRAIPGWLSDAEAMALLVAARGALAREGAAGHLVEIGSHCGKATLLLGRAAEAAPIEARVSAIDRFNGVTGSREDKLTREPVTRGRFDGMLAASGLSPWVSARTGEAGDLATGEPVDLLLVDGLHDYPAVAADFAAFEPALTGAARVAFHDYADYFPGVVAFVDELVDEGEWEVETVVESLCILRRTAAAAQEARRLAAAQA
jgi:hypothetical protein